MLASRVITNLSGEQDRWSTSIRVYAQAEGDLQSVQVTSSLRTESLSSGSAHELGVTPLQFKCVDHMFGNILLAAAFVSYAGPFSEEFRKSLVVGNWIPGIIAHGIPITEPITPLDILSDMQLQVHFSPAVSGM